MSEDREIQLTAQARLAIRRYVWQVIMPSGLAAVVVAAVGGWLVKKVGTNEAYMSAMTQLNARAEEIGRVAGTVEQLKS